jgi:peroxiredoxin
MLQIGDSIPDVTVWLGPRQPMTMQDLVDDGPKLLLFYPFDWSATCTNELELVRDRSEEFTEAGVLPVGISRDSPWTHIAWTQALDLNFGLLSDWNAEAVRGFDVTQDFRGFKDIAQRSAFLIDAGGVIRGAWEYDSGEVPDVDELLNACRSLTASATS